MGKTNYLTGIRETDSRIRRIVKEGSAGTPLSPIVEFGNNLNEIRERLFHRLGVNFTVSPALPCKLTAPQTELYLFTFSFIILGCPEYRDHQPK